MTRRRRPAVPLPAALCEALVAAPACQHQPPARGFTVRYEDPAPADTDAATLLRTRKPAERAAAALNAYLALPQPVTVLARSCAGEGTGYDPDSRRIELCYDDVAQERELLTDEEAVADVITETVHHEAGHALVDALRLPFPSARAEEDAADRFAALMLIREGPQGERALRNAAAEYLLVAAADPEDDSEHAPPAERAATHLCLLHGASPARHPDLSPHATCTPDWPTTHTTWTKALTRFLR
ncbi:DUF4344 domain-containing metallopeptidase [Streptomyces sp. SPB4]|uniref:DUF4344 domain-containing metallopeptidase n=1 Tax=Streptomyces sp. SPB4 TaxID=2940553 RepID=UPI002475FFC7|nr:DUF4344 domain-containing metallopeptidase [Streptomyces sp. SPB4]MDH6544451.1 hypothetical protein [Streptomyces sp. SPB4]